MQITDIKIRRLIGDGRMKAVASVVLDNELVVHDIKVIEGPDRMFLAMPSRKGNDGTFRDIVHPLNASMRERLEDGILEMYRRELQAQGSEDTDNRAENEAL